MPSRTLSEDEFNAIRDQVLQHAPPNLKADEFQRYVGPAMEQALGIAENTAAPLQGSALARALSGLWDTLNPITMAEGVYKSVRHPIDTAASLMDAQKDQFRKAGTAPTLAEKAGHYTAGVLPVLGPAAANIAERGVETGDVAGMVGGGLGLVAPFGADLALNMRRGFQQGMQQPALLERAATSQVAEKVLGPGNAAYKGKARAIAPEILKRGLSGGRAELAQIADEGMAEAGARIDAAVDAAGGPSKPIAVQMIISPLDDAIDKLSVRGVPIEGAADRVAQLKARIDQINALATNGELSYGNLKKIRDVNYQVADQSRGYERTIPMKSDEGFAARETGSAIRGEFAAQNPAAAAANADFAFFKTLNDVLDPALGRPKQTAPPAGVTGGSRTVGAVVGNMISPQAAFVMSTVIPWMKEFRSTPAWQLMDAQKKMALAEAIRTGNNGKAIYLLKEAAKYTPRGTGAAVLTGAAVPATPPADTSVQR